MAFITTIPDKIGEKPVRYSCADNNRFTATELSQGLHVQYKVTDLFVMKYSLTDHKSVIVTEKMLQEIGRFTTCLPGDIIKDLTKALGYGHVFRAEEKEEVAPKTYSFTSLVAHQESFGSAVETSKRQIEQLQGAIHDQEKVLALNQAELDIIEADPRLKIKEILLQATQSLEWDKLPPEAFEVLFQLDKIMNPTIGSAD